MQKTIKRLVLCIIVILIVVGGYSVFMSWVGQKYSPDQVYHGAKLLVKSDEMSKKIYQRYGINVGITINQKSEIADNSKKVNVISKITLTYFVDGKTYKEMMRSGDGKPNRSPMLKDMVKKTGALIRKQFPGAPEHYLVGVKVKPGDYEKLFEEREEEVNLHKELIEKYEEEMEGEHKKSFWMQYWEKMEETLNSKTE